MQASFPCPESVSRAGLVSMLPWQRGQERDREEQRGPERNRGTERDRGDRRGTHSSSGQLCAFDRHFVPLFRALSVKPFRCHMAGEGALRSTLCRSAVPRRCLLTSALSPSTPSSSESGGEKQLRPPLPERTHPAPLCPAWMFTWSPTQPASAPSGVFTWSPTQPPSALYGCSPGTPPSPPLPCRGVHLSYL